MRVTTVEPDVARRTIGRAWTGATAARCDDDAALGTVTLRPHQRAALGRLRAALDRHGGALLADAVGLGKTYVALALARDAPTTVVAPAALRATWQAAAARCETPVTFLSFEALSRGAAPSARPPSRLIVVDEAHHARNPATRRWRALASLCIGARVLLVTATPVHNSRRDLRALLALFLGDRAARLRQRDLLAMVVRRTRAELPADDAATLPTAERTRWRRMRGDERIAHALRAIPPPLPVRGGRGDDVLWRIGLARAWASSDAALRTALRRRLAIGTALDGALEAGRRPSQRELRAWTVSDDAVQLAIPLFAVDEETHDTAAALREDVRRHVAGVRAALAALQAGAERDARRACWLRAIRRRHAGRPVVAFTHSAATAHAIYRRVACDGGVGLLTARGGRIASGALSRRELLDRFAPAGAGAPPPRTAERVELLIATDCLSEGLDLRDASVVVHLDVPWTPARLAQRVGRTTRLGATHERVAVYGLAPHDAARAWLRLGARLRRKARAARMGERGARLGRRLERWAALPGAAATSGLVVAAVDAARPGYLAVVHDGARPRLLARVWHGATDALRAVERAARRVDAGAPAPVDDVAVQAMRRDVGRWLAEREADALLAMDEDGGSTKWSGTTRRLDAILGAAPAHRRHAVARLVADLRARLGAPMAAGLESRVRSAIAAAHDEAALGPVVDLLRASAHAGAPEPGPARLLAAIVLGRRGDAAP